MAFYATTKGPNLDRVALLKNDRIVACDILPYGSNTRYLRDRLFSWQDKQNGIPEDPIEAALWDNRIVKGMTEDQGYAAFCGSSAAIGRQINRSHGEHADGTRTVRWECWERSDLGVGVLMRAASVVLRDGKIVAIQDDDRILGH